LQKSLTVSSRILSRAHSNYLAQINILMNERQEHTADDPVRRQYVPDAHS
jgi:magnesium transporter